jgi:VWFA-related protein
MMFTCVSLLAALVRAGHAAQDSPPQRFRAGVDLITIDVAAVDAKGRPVEDLKPVDFIVKVDGKVRPTTSAELIKVDRGKPVSARPSELISTNDAPQNARRIVVAIDQTLITPGALAPLQRTASEFIGRLTPNDYAGFVAFPEPGPRVDFTTDKARVRKALEGIIGQPARIFSGDFNIGLTEAFTITGPERPYASSVDPSDPRPMREQIPPTVLRVLERGCRGMTIDELLDPATDPSFIRQCRRDVYSESMNVASNARLEATLSLRALERMLRDLALLDGPKTMIVFSAGLVNEDPTLLNEAARLAALARTTINVIAVEPERNQELRNQPGGLSLSSSSSQGGLSLMDRSFELAGLEQIADRTNGTLFRGVAAGKGIFERLESELSAWYLVAVDRQPGDPDTQRVEVEIRRRGVTLRSNRNAVSVNPSGRRPLDELLSEALSSPFTIPGLPLRISTFAQRDADPTKYRLRVAADIGQPGEPGGEFALGYVLTDEKGRVVTSAGSRRNLASTASGPNQVLQYDTSLAVAPGNYQLRVGVVDGAGRRGTLVRRVELPSLAGVEVQTSDLIVGNLPAEGETLSPRVQPQITASEVAAYLEIYLQDEAAANVTVTLDIAEGDATPALATQTLTLRPGETPSSRIATGFVPATMTPGRYVARATVRRDGDTVKTLTRPITIVRDTSVVSKPPTRARGVPITSQLQQLTAAYVAGVVNGLANIVAQEEFVLSKPDRRVTADLLLVRYPGTRRDLIPYRDVSHLDGKVVDGRDQRLVDLFLKPTDAIRQQARQIMASADAYVPSVFNPMFVLGFLQSDFQSRFELTVGDAGTDWPRAVKAVAFVEVGRPTLLRTGPFGDIDVPTRGTAWIEEATGRILQTELQVGRGRGIPSMVTKFRLDDRLQVTVPVEMKTENPDGMATYTNFRRFGVDTDAAIPTPPAPPPER